MDGWCTFESFFGQIYVWMDDVSLRYRKDGWMDGYV